MHADARHAFSNFAKGVQQMRLLTSMLVAMTLSTLAAADDKSKESKDSKFDKTKLIGNWKYVAAVKDGEKVDEARLKNQAVIISKETFTLKSPESTFVMKYEFDEKKSPVQVKFTMTESPFGAGSKAEGIIELNGDDLKICYAPMEGDKPPTKFEAKEGSKHFFFTLKRAK
jgi:uncharacterized protein (TIGR03067 family)